MMKVQNLDENSSVDQMQVFDKFLLSLKLIKVIKIHIWWKLLTAMSIQNCDENIPIWWKFHIAMNFHSCDENQPVWRKLMIAMKGS